MTLRRGIDSTSDSSFLPTFPPRACLIRVKVPLTSARLLVWKCSLHPSALGTLILPVAPCRCIPCSTRVGSNEEVHQQFDVSSATHSDHPPMQLYRETNLTTGSSGSLLPLSSESDMLT